MATKGIRVIENLEPGVDLAEISFEMVDWTEYPWKREITDSRVDKMGSEWDARAAEIPTACQIDDRTVIIEGNHRSRARMKRGEATFTARYVGKMNHPEAAALALKVATGRVAFRPYTRWCMSLASEEPHTVAINDLVEEIGGHVRRESRAGIGAVGALWKLEKNGGLLLVRLVLTTIRDMWPEHDLTGMAVSKDIIEGFGLIFGVSGFGLNFGYEGGISRKRFISQVGEVTPVTLQKRLARQEHEERGCDKGAASVYYAALRLYKGRSRTDFIIPRPDWRAVHYREDLKERESG